MDQHKTITMITGNLLDDVRKAARWRYTISQISLLLNIDREELRSRIADPDDPLSQAYHAGILESQAAYRQKVIEAAESGNTFALGIVDKWERAQKEEELGGYV